MTISYNVAVVRTDRRFKEANRILHTETVDLSPRDTMLYATRMYDMWNCKTTGKIVVEMNQKTC